MSAVAAPSRLERVLDEAVARGHTDIQILPWSPEWRDQALPIMHEMHKNSIFASLPLDEAKVIRQLAACGNLVPDRYFRIAVLHGEGLGAFYGHVQRSFFCDEILAHDMGWWVKKDARGSLAAPLLLRDFEQWAREKGARKVMVGQSTAINIEATTKLFQACGYRVTGYNTVKDI
jgi:hypothetical protein